MNVKERHVYLQKLFANQEFDQFKREITLEDLQYQIKEHAVSFTTLAVWHNNEIYGEIIPFLTSKGDDVYFEFHKRDAPILSAIYYLNYENVCHLINGGLNVDYIYKISDTTAIEYAISVFEELVFKETTTIQKILLELLLNSKNISEHHYPKWMNPKIQSIKKGRKLRKKTLVTMSLICKNKNLPKGITRVIISELSTLRLDESWIREEKVFSSL